MEYNNNFPKLTTTAPLTSGTPYSATGLLGNTIEEKTRRILGWTDHNAPSITTSGPLNVAASVGQRKADKGRKTRSASLISTAPYPYSLLANDSNRGRKNSCPSLCNMNETAILRQQLTPPPSPVSTHNGINIVSMPRLDRPPSLNPPPPPAYHSIPNMYSVRNPPCDTIQQDNCPPLDYSPNLPISPVSPIPSGQQVQQECRLPPLPIRISTSEVFERLRKEVPHIPKETSKFRVLVQTVANVIELETKLAQLQEQTRTLSSILISQNGNGNASSKTSSVSTNNVNYEQIAIDTTSPATTSSAANEPISLTSSCRGRLGPADVPDDLQGIDVTAFKSMMCSPQSFGPSSSPTVQNSVTWMKSSNNTNSFANVNVDYADGHYDCELFTTLNFNGLDPLLVDTSY